MSRNQQQLSLILLNINQPTILTDNPNQPEGNTCCNPIANCVRGTCNFIGQNFGRNLRYITFLATLTTLGLGAAKTINEEGNDNRNDMLEISLMVSALVTMFLYLSYKYVNRERQAANNNRQIDRPVMVTDLENQTLNFQDPENLDLREPQYSWLHVLIPFLIVSLIAWGIQLCISSDFRTIPGIMSSLCSIIGNFSGNMAFMYPQYAPLLSATDNSLEGLAIALITNVQQRPSFSAIIAGLFSGGFYGHIGGLFYQKCIARFIPDDFSPGNNTGSHSKTMMGFIARGMIMETVRTIVFTSIKGFQGKSCSEIGIIWVINSLTGGISASVLGIGVYYARPYPNHRHQLWSQFLLNATGCLSQFGVPSIENILQNTFLPPSNSTSRALLDLSLFNSSRAIEETTEQITSQILSLTN